ncbi:MAG: hypothetical protein V4647_00660 [Pseudomonadota bacterium]
MTEWDWLRLVYLAMVLGLLIGTVRTHRIGGRKALVMILAWLCIFMVAAGIAAIVTERTAEPAVEAAPLEGDAVLT